LTLVQVLRLVAANNFELVGFEHAVTAFDGLVQQAGVWSNPELELEIEEIGWDRPGVSESEFRIGLAQELALWGSRSARRRVAQQDREAARIDHNIARFDLYADTKRRFYDLVHAQAEVTTTAASVELAEKFSEAIAVRVENGAGLAAELLMSELELQRIRLELGEVTSRLTEAQLALAAMYGGNTVALIALDDEIAPLEPADAARWEPLLTGGRDIAPLDAEEQVLRAQLDMEATTARPNPTLSAGYTRLQAEKANTFVLGLSLPLPVMDRNHGTRAGLASQSASLIELRRQALAEARAELQTRLERWRQLVTLFESLGNDLIPKATQTLGSVEEAYEAGGLTYTAVLEAGRTLVEFRARRNELRREIRMIQIEVESMLGLPYERLLTLE
jgi:cobalt-zinc-cadmium efflux system outer membrane protein